MNLNQFEKFGVTELNEQENKTVNGGNPVLIGIGIGIGVMALYDFANGVYTGIKQELAKEA